MSEATHIVLSDTNSVTSNYTRKHRQYVVHVQVRSDCKLLFLCLDDSHGVI